jgi:hypothetical protein
LHLVELWLSFGKKTLQLLFITGYLQYHGLNITSKASKRITKAFIATLKAEKAAGKGVQPRQTLAFLQGLVPETPLVL